MEYAGCQNREVRLTPTISSSFQESGMLWCQAFRPDMGKMYVTPLCSMVIHSWPEGTESRVVARLRFRERDLP